MKYRITSAFVSALCLISAVSCGQIGYETVSDINEISTDTSSEETTVKSTEVVTEPENTPETEPKTEPETEAVPEPIDLSCFEGMPRNSQGAPEYLDELPEISAEIPPEAVEKVTMYCSYSDDDTRELEMIFYNDAHGNRLLTLFPDRETGELKPSRNVRYEYNDNGDITYYKDRCDNYLTEEFYEYNSNNQLTKKILIAANKNYRSEIKEYDWDIGHHAEAEEYEYDDNGNLIGCTAVNYMDRSDTKTELDPLKQTYTYLGYGIYDMDKTEYGNRKYDNNGRLISYQEFDTSISYDENGNPEPGLTDAFPSTKHELTYDENGNVTGHKKYRPDGSWELITTYEYDSEGGVLVESEGNPNLSYRKTYEYDPVCGKQTKYLTEDFDANGEVRHTGLFEYEYDSEGRLLKEYKSSDNSERKAIDIYEYENL